MRFSVDDFKKVNKVPLVIVLDNIRSLHNVGSVFRTADAFRLEAIYLCGITACPPHRDIHKTALGATDSVTWKYCKTALEAVRELKNKKYKVLAIEQCKDAIKLANFTIEPGDKYGLVFGNEVHGVGEEVVAEVDDCIEIPQFGTKHSLNISVSVGVIVWDFLLKMNFYKLQEGR